MLANALYGTVVKRITDPTEGSEIPPWVACLFIGNLVIFLPVLFLVCNPAPLRTSHTVRNLGN